MDDRVALVHDDAIAQMPMLPVLGRDDVTGVDPGSGGHVLSSRES
jgi:hypothetical protein